MRTVALISQARKIEHQILSMIRPMLAAKPMGCKGDRAQWLRAKISAPINNAPPPVHSQPTGSETAGWSSFCTPNLEGVAAKLKFCEWRLAEPWLQARCRV